MHASKKTESRRGSKINVNNKINIFGKVDSNSKHQGQCSVQPIDRKASASANLHSSGEAFAGC